MSCCDFSLRGRQKNADFKSNTLKTVAPEFPIVRRVSLSKGNGWLIRLILLFKYRKSVTTRLSYDPFLGIKKTGEV